MKKMFAALCAAVCVHAAALDTRSGEFIEYLLNLPGPGAPEVFDDAVVFTAPSFYKRVGIAFASENFSRIHWFVKLLVPIDDTAAFDPNSKIPPELLRDSGILFFTYTPEKSGESIEYRLIIDGLWSTDPLNARKRADPLTGVELSLAPSPRAKPPQTQTEGCVKQLSLVYHAASGETITVAGDFNGWDPFMYPLRETSPGVYTISIPLPAGTWRYVFFHRGRRVLDPSNFERAYAKNGMSANIILVK